MFAYEMTTSTAQRRKPSFVKRTEQILRVVQKLGMPISSLQYDHTRSLAIVDIAIRNSAAQDAPDKNEEADEALAAWEANH